MSTKPILFNTDMVRAILDGRKTVTRRVVKPQPKGPLVLTLPGGCWPGYFEEAGTSRVQRPPYCPGDILYVREAWAKQQGIYWHKAGLILDEKGRDTHGTIAPAKWRPSIHMPREAARIFLRVTGVRVERLQDISMKDVRNEGIEYDIERPVASYGKFVELWDSTIRPGIRALYGWGGNPWVWVIEFERYEKSEAAP